MIRPDILAAVEAEQARADAIHGPGAMGRPFLPAHARVTVLTEEVGKVARAVLDGDDEGLRAEVTQLAALCLSWLAVLP